MKVSKEQLKALIKEELDAVMKEVEALNPITRLGHEGPVSSLKRGEQPMRNLSGFSISVYNVAGRPRAHEKLNMTLQSALGDKFEIISDDDSVEGTSIIAVSASDALEALKAVREAATQTGISSKNIVIHGTASEEGGTGVTMSDKELEKRADMEAGISGMKAGTGKVEEAGKRGGKARIDGLEPDELAAAAERAKELKGVETTERAFAAGRKPKEPIEKRPFGGKEPEQNLSGTAKGARRRTGKNLEESETELEEGKEELEETVEVQEEAVQKTEEKKEEPKDKDKMEEGEDKQMEQIAESFRRFTKILKG